MIFKKCFVILLAFLQIFILTGCGNEQNPTELLKAKVTEEMNYIDSKIINMANLVNNISMQNYKVETKEVEDTNAQPSGSTQAEQQSQGGQSSSGQGSNQSSSSSGSSSGQSSQGGQTSQKVEIYEMISNNILTSTESKTDWNTLKSEIENLYSTWNTVTLDLYKLNIQQDSINSFSRTLEEATINIKNEKKKETLASLSKLYNYIPMYVEYFSQDNVLIDLKYTKYHVLKAYSLVEDKNWEEIRNQLDLAIAEFVPIVNDLNSDSNNAHAINRTYIILVETRNCVEQEDADVFYINYRNFIQEINLL